MTETPTAQPDRAADADTPQHRYTAELAGQIEGAWQQTWAVEGTFNVPNPVGELAPPDGTVPADKMFVQDMFPYPSGRVCTSDIRWATSPPTCTRATTG